MYQFLLSTDGRYACLVLRCAPQLMSPKGRNRVADGLFITKGGESNVR